MSNFKLDIEEPYCDVVTMRWQEAALKYRLDANDLDRMLDGKVVWIGSMAISLHEPEWLLKDLKEML